MTVVDPTINNFRFQNVNYFDNPSFNHLSILSGNHDEDYLDNWQVEMLKLNSKFNMRKYPTYLDNFMPNLIIRDDESLVDAMANCLYVEKSENLRDIVFEKK